MADHANPPAFPQQCADALDVGMVHEGMSLRDYFAGQALAGICGNEHAIASLSWSPDPHRDRAELVYAIADAMLATRTQVQP